MKNYEKPVVMINEELAEGVYAASGVTYYDDCYTVTIKEIKQELQDGRMSYVRKLSDATQDTQEASHRPFEPFRHFSVDPQRVVHLSCGTQNMAVGIHLFMRQVSLMD